MRCGFEPNFQFSRSLTVVQIPGTRDSELQNVLHLDLQSSQNHGTYTLNFALKAIMLGTFQVHQHQLLEPYTILGQKAMLCGYFGGLGLGSSLLHRLGPLRPSPRINISATVNIIWLTERTWILCKDLSRGRTIIPL